MRRRIVTGKCSLSGDYEVDPMDTTTSRYLEFELRGVIISLKGDILLDITNNAAIHRCKIQAKEEPYCLALYLFVKNEYDVFGDEALKLAKECIDGLIINFITNAINTDFINIHYLEEGRFDNGKHSYFAESNSCTLYVLEEEKVDDVQSIFAPSVMTDSAEMKENLTLLKAIVSMDNIIARYILIYEMLSGIVVPTGEQSKQKCINEYICNLFKNQSVDGTGIQIYKKNANTICGVIRHDNTPHLTLLRNAIAHNGEYQSKYIEFESDVWRHTRPLLNVLVYAIKNNAPPLNSVL